MLKQAAPVVLIVAAVFILLEALHVQRNNFSFGWFGVFLLVLWVFLSGLIP